MKPYEESRQFSDRTATVTDEERARTLAENIPYHLTSGSGIYPPVSPHMTMGLPFSDPLWFPGYTFPRNDVPTNNIPGNEGIPYVDFRASTGIPADNGSLGAENVNNLL
ncbi:MAG: hypothetical protein IJ449_09100 [Clostridia bacterium]|nr:hypothetical protein [Clostridia bacterium]